MPLQSSSRLPRRLSNTNTDTLCSDTSESANVVVKNVKLFFYRYHLWTGLYMLDTHERWAFHVLGWIALVSFGLYVGVFLGGFLEGLKNGVQLQQHI